MSYTIKSGREIGEKLGQKRGEKIDKELAIKREGTMTIRKNYCENII
ncbi:hypothetical protein [Megasphaera elsdenii]